MSGGTEGRCPVPDQHQAREFARSPYGAVADEGADDGGQTGAHDAGTVALFVFVRCPGCAHGDRAGTCRALSPAGDDPGAVIAAHGHMVDGMLVCGRYQGRD